VFSVKIKALMSKVAEPAQWVNLIRLNKDLYVLTLFLLVFQQGGV
jgi:hypothetical protein